MKKHTTSSHYSRYFTVATVVAAFLSISYYYIKSHTREYNSGIKVSAKVDDDEEKGALGMMQFFFNARKNITTGKMDYAAMAAANIAANKMMTNSATARTLATALSSITWSPLGPSNIGGRTRAILIDSINDPSHNTLFAAAVSGGIWVSKNAGATWDSVPGNDKLSSMEACDIAEDKNGVIYVGTGEGFALYSEGEGFSCAMLGGGIFKSTDKGVTFTVLSSTVPSSNNAGVNWAYVNRIAVDPINPSNLYAATNTGLFGSSNGGTSWTQLKNTVNSLPLSNNSLDVKISRDGQLLVAFSGSGVGSGGFYGYPNGTYLSGLKPFASVGSGKLPTNGVRTEFAISPTNANYVYATVIMSQVLFDFSQGGAGTGIYFNATALSSGGGHWYEIGPGGTTTFDPFSSSSSQDQASYDNVLAVAPINPGYLLLGGTTLWSWEQQSATDTIGVWRSITTYQNGGNPNFVHSDQHAIAFDMHNPNVIYNGCDGGIYRSNNGTTVWLPNGVTAWEPMNRDYNVTQFTDIEFAPNVSPLGEGIMGGTQDNGTPYVNGYQYYYQDAISVQGGDGGRCAISQLDPEIYYTTSDNDGLEVGAGLSSVTASTQMANAYTKIIGKTRGANIDSMSNYGGCFYNQIALYENPYDVNLPDSMLWIADSNYPNGHTVHPISPNGFYPFPYKLTSAITKGDTIKMVNPVVSKIAVGLFANTGVWITMQAINLSSTAIWMPIGGPLSTPDAFSGFDPVHSLVWTPDGNTLFVGTEGGQLFRFTNLDSIIDTSYTTGATYGIAPSVPGTPVVNHKCKVVSTNLDSNHTTFFGRDILSISVDPKNGNNVMVTLGNYGSGSYVYYTNSALSTTSVPFTACQGNLPPMPVYSSITHVSSKNDLYPNSAMVGTEHGVYSTTDITVASPIWTFSNSGMANTLVLALKQQTLLPWQCNNAGAIYVGTHGRGAFYSPTLLYTGIQPVADATKTEADLKIYPDPMSTQGTLEYSLTTATDITITIYDISGRVVKTIPLNKQVVGDHLATINTQDFSVGTYIATVTGTDYLKSARFVVVR